MTGNVFGAAMTCRRMPRRARAGRAPRRDRFPRLSGIPFPLPPFLSNLARAGDPPHTPARQVARAVGLRDEETGRLARCTPDAAARSRRVGSPGLSHRPERPRYEGHHVESRVHGPIAPVGAPRAHGCTYSDGLVRVPSTVLRGAIPRPACRHPGRGLGRSVHAGRVVRPGVDGPLRPGAQGTGDREEDGGPGVRAAPERVDHRDVYPIEQLERTSARHGPACPAHGRRRSISHTV